jgi:DnaJ-domain-containing protein 1
MTTMTGPTTARQVVHALATHAVLPPASELPASGDALRALLADLVQGERSPHAGLLREVEAERGVPVPELARRAQFTLACLLLPASGSFYEVLGVRPNASQAEIRRHWAAAIQRYHPDRFAGTTGWPDAQARRLITAYQTLRDPELRRQYDASLARQRRAIVVPLAPSRRSQRRPRLTLPRSVGIGVLIGMALAYLVTWAWVYLMPPHIWFPLKITPVPGVLEPWNSQADREPTSDAASSSSPVPPPDSSTSPAPPRALGEGGATSATPKAPPARGRVQRGPSPPTEDGTSARPADAARSTPAEAR